MRVLVSGSSGLVGTALLERLKAGGHTTKRLVRRAPVSQDEATWDPEKGVLDPAVFDDVDAVVHLAGENIADGRWSAEKKRRIRESRTASTRLLAETIASLEKRPQVFVSASATGYYGDRGDEPLDERSASGPADDFLVSVCRDWEEASEPVSKAGVRLVHLRIGVVLSPKGGALKKMLLPFKLGAGGKIGSGRQYMSWIALEDLVTLFVRAVEDGSMSGAYNAVAPTPVTNAEFTRALGAALSRPTFIPMPAFAARLAFGELADHLLLGGHRVVSTRLAEAGHEFRHREIGPTLKSLVASG